MADADNAAIVGAGTTEKFGKLPDRTRLSLSAEALQNALDDAGLVKGDIDGLMVNMGYPVGTHYDRMCEALGLDIRFGDQKWLHGRFVGTTVQQAAMAVQDGLADYIAVGAGVKQNLVAPIGLMESVSLTEVGGTSEHVPRPWYGLIAPVADSALATRYYMEKYGATSEDLAHVSSTIRHHASLDPRSVYTEEYTIEEHQASRWVVEPLRLFDCAAVTDGAAYVIITSGENAQSMSNEAGVIETAEGIHAGRDEHIFSRPGMGIRTQREYEYDASVTDPIYESVGLSRDDIDALYTYDAFAPNVWYALERWGFCEPGEAYRFARDGAIGIDGELPVNTHGGLLSNGHLSAWNHVVEMYNQLMGRCGDRQLSKADVLQFGTPFGDTFMLRRE